MDHVVYLDAKANELEKLSDGSKTMIIRGATGRKLPYGRDNEGDILYFINNTATNTPAITITTTSNNCIRPEGIFLFALIGFITLFPFYSLYYLLKATCSSEGSS